MPPIWRGADKPIRVTRELQYGAEAVLWWFLEDGLSEDSQDDYATEIAAIKKFVRSRRLTIDPDTFSWVRNALDLELLAGGCEQEVGDLECDFCLWCQALILRDWMDSLMDVAGCYRSPRVEAYISHGEGNPTDDKARWDARNCGGHKSEAWL
jgi:hypothetical protein